MDVFNITHLTARYLLPRYPHHQWRLPSLHEAITYAATTCPTSVTINSWHSILWPGAPAILNPPASAEPFFFWSCFLPASIFQISPLLPNSDLYLFTLGILYFSLHFGKLFKNYTQPNLPQWLKKNNQAKIIILLCREESCFPLSLKEIITELLKYWHVFLTLQWSSPYLLLFLKIISLF